MPREIICIGVGGCGIKMADAMWNLTTYEHNIGSCGDTEDRPGNFTFDSIFHSTANGDVTPRSLFVDVNQCDADKMREKSIVKYDKECFQVAQTDATHAFGSSWSAFSSMVPSFENAMRRRAEECDSIQGIQIVSAIAGGAGSGVASAVAERAREMFPHNVVQTFAYIKQCETDVEYYNSLLGIHRAGQSCDQVTVLPSEFIRRSSQEVSSREGYSEMNKMIATILSSTTAHCRLPGFGPIDLRGQIHKLKGDIPNGDLLNISTAGGLCVPKMAGGPAPRGHILSFLRRVRKGILCDSAPTFSRPWPGSTIGAVVYSAGGFSSRRATNAIIGGAENCYPCGIDVENRYYDSAVVNVVNSTGVRHALGEIYDHSYRSAYHRSHFHRVLDAGSPVSTEKDFVEVLDGIARKIHAYHVAEEELRPYRG